MISRAKSWISLRGRTEERVSARYRAGSQNAQYSPSAILMLELSRAYTEIEERHVQLHRSRLSLRIGGADYGWLMSSQFATLKVPNGERAELQRLCERVNRDECNTIVAYFRTRQEKCHRGSDVVSVFRKTVDEVIKARKRSIQPKAWLTAKVSRSNMNKIDGVAADTAQVEPAHVASTTYECTNVEEGGSVRIQPEEISDTVHPFSNALDTSQGSVESLGKQ